ncbi:TfoX/Sxy family protein [Acidovorax sp. SUPP3334]|uniref:TfoX/Sxy family protein n=1 Tax=Acidovorax sp. SUPP3334 TaxID=2920881 RepID=UPI0023DE4B96|nr:TfoX/Sxy family protein [Acidovorax sp. SUPP3334]GKT21566.1 TfoX/Sxy family protein [Acidovorax sp. SUPP3334]
MSAFAQELPSVFAPWRPVQLRRMFGGWGVFHEGLMLALVIHDTLYLKADAQTEPAFERKGLRPFFYERSGRPVAPSYRQAPAEMYEGPAEAIEWASRAWEAVLRSAAKPQARSRRPRDGDGDSEGEGESSR